MIDRAWVIAAVIVLPTIGHPFVWPVHPVKCQFAPGVATTVTLLPALTHWSVWLTLPLPFVAVSSQYCVCHCHVRTALLVSVSVTLVAPPTAGSLPVSVQPVATYWVRPWVSRPVIRSVSVVP